VAATHRNLEEMIRDHQFRSDLYYRLNVFPIYIPPLRERPEDVPLLVRHFVQEFARKMNKSVAAISPETMDALTQYPWPGNIRELQNVIERSVVIHQKGNFSVRKCCLSRQPLQRNHMHQSFRRSASEDRQMIDSALAEARGRVSGPSGAAAMLGIPASTLESKIRSMNINKYNFKTSARTSLRGSRISAAELL
jgi:formate hydrogenlyase transcriptional activator